MSTTTRNIITFIIGAIAVLFIANWVFKVVLGILGLILPVAIVCGAAYLGYQAFGRKALGGGRRTLP